MTPTQAAIEAAILGNDQPFSLKEVLKMLIHAAEILYHKKNYDGHFHEEIRICIGRGKEIIEKLDNYALCQDQKEAQATACDFANWIHEENYNRKWDEDEWQMMNPVPPIGKQNDDNDDTWEPMIGEKYTTAQLFSLFQQSKQS